MTLSEADAARVAAAVTAAEATSDGEIVTVLARRSDAYADVALTGAALAMLLWLAALATWPGIARAIDAHLVDAWRPDGAPAGALLAIALIGAGLAFLLVRLLLADARARLLVTPGGLKAHRVRARAITLFRAAVEGRTRAKTGVLLYLSLAERRAEIVADAAIASRVAPERWGEAMAALIAAVKDGRPADGMVDAVRLIGAVIAEHFPRSPDDTDELPDRLILL